MSIVSVSQAPDSPTMSVDKDGNVSIKTTWKVISNDITDDVTDIIAATGLPPYYSSYPDYDEAVANVFSVKRIIGNSTAWLVEITFNTPTDNNQHADPTQDLPTISISTENYQVAANDVSDPDADAIVNSFGDPYEPQPAADAGRVIIRIKRNEDISTDVASLISQYQDHVNSLDYWGFTAHTVKCQNINANGPKIRNQPDGTQIYYIDMEYVFSIMPSRGWDITLLDQGMNYNDAGQTLTFKSQDGVPKIGLLNGSGGAATGGPPPTPVFLDPIQIYPAVDFAALGLPEAFVDAVPRPTGFNADF